MDVKLIAFGSKKIYLPKFTVALVRTPRLSPYHARFLVPLDFSKYDLRDYLYHAYSVKCFNIRSYVKQMPVRDTREQPRHWFRPDSQKYMTVELEQPFVWPKTPNLEPWGQQERQRELREAVVVNGAGGASEARKAAWALRDQVKKLLNKQVLQPDPEDATWKEKAEFRKSEQEKMERMTRVEAWEKQRTEKVVEGDDGSKYAIKA
ncbi:ribosomal [Pyrenophora seminiperda CCB06]|uniref:Large ribosomal subunit protein uL23m n=1 Tax=Pyrenophora seminiperda CCB06 TaxID=1302712 RepID=A0A3M7M3S3_9PLEO|nr:ribosomal [Pyrenophora seminiperda CCB06]